MTSPLTIPVYTGEAYKPFGDFTLADVEGRATELKAMTGWGPTARVASVAMGWTELARLMATTGASTVKEIDAEKVERFARKLWVVPPGGSLL